MKLPPPVFAGFFPKATLASPDWLAAPAVREIASVSCCLSPAPDGWITHWRHNALGFYASEAAALSVCTDKSIAFDLYAYLLYPLRGMDGHAEPFAPAVTAGAPPADYIFLGYDIVTQSTSDFFECSPLSCNGAAAAFGANAFCLLDGEAEAVQAMLAMSEPAAGFEPGPCHLFQVYRKPRVSPQV
jgi:hypothetical protein